jgi:hypothetical protein
LGAYCTDLHMAEEGRGRLTVRGGPGGGEILYPASIDGFPLRRVFMPNNPLSTFTLCWPERYIRSTISHSMSITRSGD